MSAYVGEDNPRSLASGLSPVHMHSHIITFLLHHHACVLCEIFDVKHLNIFQKCNDNNVKYLAMHKVQVYAGAKSTVLYGLFVCMGDNPLAKARGLSSHTDAQAIQ